MSSQMKTMRILFLEDDPYDLELIVITLNGQGFQFDYDQTKTRAGLLACLDANNYDLILSDYHMPGFDGMAALQLVMEHAPDTPFVLVSGAVGEETAIESLKAGATDYVLKNRLERLGPVVARALRENAERLSRKAAEKALRVSEERYRMISETTSDFAYAYFVQEDQTVQPEWITDGFQRLTGFTSDELAARGGWPSTIFYEDLPLVIARTERLVKNLLDVSEFRIVTKSGEIRWLRDYCQPEWSDEAKRVVRIYGAAQDITERREDGESLRLLNKAIEQSPVSVMIMDDQGLIQYVNPKFCQTTGYSIAEAMGQHFAFLDVGDHEPAFLLEMWDTLIAGQEWRGEFHNKRKNGELYWEFASIVGVKGQSGEITHFVAVKEDITQRRQIEEEHRRQERLASVGQLAAGIAHDFNNILASISLYAQMVGRSEELSARNRERIQVVGQQVEHASRLIGQILDFSRRSVLERQPVDLLPMLKEQIKLLSRTLPENISIDFDHEPGEYMVQADPTRIQQMLTNLAVNARDAMPDGGRLGISLARLAVGADQPTADLNLSTGAWIRLAVSDTGVGIPASILHNIFDPFFTTKAPGEGTGLGLAQVHGIVGQHEGHIGVKSREGAGTVFTIYLPVLVLESQSAGVLPQDEGVIRLGRGERLLVVEDEATLRDGLASTLEAWNYRVAKAANGHEALALLHAQGGAFALILSDVVMPEMGGIALFGAIKEHGWQIPMILLSGHPKNSAIDEIGEQGLAAYFTKPVNLEKLAQTLSEVLAEE